VVNALLGQRYLAEGILPTTNEINVLKHLDPEHVEAGAAQVGGLGCSTGAMRAGGLRREAVGHSCENACCSAGPPCALATWRPHTPPVSSPCRPLQDGRRCFPNF